MSKVQRTGVQAVKGLGSAKDGVEHWWLQRMSAVAMIPLTLWFAYAIVTLAGSDYLAARIWIGQPVQGTLLLAFIIAVFYHATLGLQVVIEDYIASDWAQVAAQLAMRIVMALLGLSAVVSVLRILLTPA